MDSRPPPERTAAAVEARRRRTEEMLKRVDHSLRQMTRDRAPISVVAVARRADVSRTFLYQNAKARRLIAECSASTAARSSSVRAEQVARMDAPWRERALNAEDALRTAREEIRRQRLHVGDLLGRVRDHERDWPDDSVARITAESTALKQKVQELTRHNAALAERLDAARSNMRFQDKRLAVLEAELVSARSPRPG